VYKHKFGGSDKIHSFYRNSGTAINNTFMTINVVGIYEQTTTELFILGNNSSGQAVFYLYNVPTNGLNGPYTLPAGKLLSSAQANTDFLFLGMDDGNVYGYKFSNSNTSILANVKAQKLLFNVKLNELNAAVGNKVYSYSLSTNYTLIPQGFLTAGDSLIGFEVITNK
jgi:hypothetical protein